MQWGLPPYHPALDFLVGWIMGTSWKLAGTRRVCAAVLGACLAVGLVGCGGGSDSPTGGGSPTTPPIPPERSGRLESARLLGTIPASEIAAALAAKESLAQDVVPRYGVTSYRLDYLTADAMILTLNRRERQRAHEAAKAAAETPADVARRFAHRWPEIVAWGAFVAVALLWATGWLA